MLRKYEGMFLFDPVVATDWEAIQAELSRLMSRAEARVIASGKWDERRLAYEIRGRKRGVYVLTYFEADPTKVLDLERDVQLSEALLRCLVVRVDHMSEEDMKESVAKPASQPSEDDRGGRWGRGRSAHASSENADDRPSGRKKASEESSDDDSDNAPDDSSPVSVSGASSEADEAKEADKSDE